MGAGGSLFSHHSMELSAKDGNLENRSGVSAGCTLVLKPAPETSVTALELARLIDQTDLPKGVVNVITGDADVGTEMITNPLVDKVSFTGSTEVGKVVMKNASESLKKITLECGGKSANIVLDDADLEMAVDGAIYAGSIIKVNVAKVERDC